MLHTHTHTHAHTHTLKKSPRRRVDVHANLLLSQWAGHSSPINCERRDGAGFVGVCAFVAGGPPMPQCVRASLCLCVSALCSVKMAALAAIQRFIDVPLAFLLAAFRSTRLDRRRLFFLFFLCVVLCSTAAPKRAAHGSTSSARSARPSSNDILMNSAVPPPPPPPLHSRP